jgi:hypothetical protein
MLPLPYSSTAALLCLGWLAGLLCGGLFSFQSEFGLLPQP